MKCLNFSAIEILDSLLTKKKKQTIRPAWKSIWGVAPSVEFTESKPPRFKVGDEIKLMWTGNMDMLNKLISNKRECIVGDLKKVSFGTGTITKRTMLLITKQGNDYLCFERKNKRENWIELSIGNKQELAELDGFKSFRDLIIYFEKEHNIDFTTEKEFYRYLYKWL